MVLGMSWYQLRSGRRHKTKTEESQAPRRVWYQQQHQCSSYLLNTLWMALPGLTTTLKNRYYYPDLQERPMRLWELWELDQDHIE